MIWVNQPKKVLPVLVGRVAAAREVPKVSPDIADSSCKAGAAPSASKVIMTGIGAHWA